MVSWKAKQAAKRWARDAAKRVAPAVQSMVPHPNPVSTALGEMSLAHVSIKNLGYELGRAIAKQSLTGATEPVEGPLSVALPSKPVTQADIESPWLWYWCQRLGTPVLYHRKIWEFAYALQVLWDAGMLQPGKRAIGFGCGEEPLPSLLAAFGVEVTITDQAEEAARRTGWTDIARQHTGSLDVAYRPEIVDRATFNRLASVRYVDMTAINADLRDYDFCWSICAFEHLGSLAAGQKFVLDSMKVLKPGGIAVHTTEFNVDNSGKTHEGVSLCLYQQKHLEEIGQRLIEAGDQPAPMSFDAGTGPIDNFIDLPPYSFEAHDYLQALVSGEDQRMAHLKMAMGGYPTTCYGLWARRGG